MLRIGTTVLNVGDLARAVTFWSAALDYRLRGDPVDDDFVTLVATTGDGPRLSLQRSDADPPEIPHSHLDLYADDAGDQRAQIARLVGLGAVVVDWPLYEDGPRDFEVLADPDGNRFCVIDTSFAG